MIEFAEFMTDYSSLFGKSKQKKEYKSDAECFRKSLQEYLLSDTTQIYSDYMGLQYYPVENGQSKFVEPIEWRQDEKCTGLNSLGTKAKCTNPEGGKNCCYKGICVQDKDCTCEECVAYQPLYKTSKLRNQFSIHFGIVNMYPIIFGQVKDTDVLHSILR